jgi:hypothetical protein
MRKELRPILELLGALSITPFLILGGLIYSFVKPFLGTKNKPFWFIVKTFFRYWGNILLQTWKSVQYWFHHTAIYLDYMWNVVTGDLLEYIFSDKENTWFGTGRTTVSASIGQLEHKGLLNKKGLWFSGFLDKVFKEENHCLNAYHKELSEKD